MISYSNLCQSHIRPLLLSKYLHEKLELHLESFLDVMPAVWQVLKGLIYQG